MLVKVTKTTGRLPGRVRRSDGYVNMLNKYGTAQDSASRYFFTSEGKVPDQQLNTLYAENGLFTTIIDSPSEEAIKHGIDLGISDESIDTYVRDALDSLDWEENGMTAIKWARLFGGAIIVMLIDDGAQSLEAPLSWNRIRGIHGLMVTTPCTTTQPTTLRSSTNPSSTPSIPLTAPSVCMRAVASCSETASSPKTLPTRIIGSGVCRSIPVSSRPSEKPSPRTVFP